MSTKEKELARLEKKYTAKITEIAMALQYGDKARAMRAQVEAANIKGQMARVRRDGVQLRSRGKENRFLGELYVKYGKCEDVFSLYQNDY